MGWDISYHPIAAEEIRSVYFKGIEDVDHYKFLSKQFAMDDFYTEQLRIRFEEARKLEQSVPFNKGHAFCAAIVSGFLRKHWYLRGSAFSFLMDDDLFTKYVTDWKTLVPPGFAERTFENQLTENYCGGVFIANAALCQLREDYKTDEEIKSKMDETFSHGRLAVFWLAVDYAIENNLGLLEASEVIEPNPFDLNSTRSLTNLMNCELDGVFLYAGAAAEQVKNAISTNESNAPVKKKGFWAKLFGK
jgi:hypothetical protein